MTIKKISILGCGWYGIALAKAFVAQGIQVKGSTTSANKQSLLADAHIEPYLVSFLPESESYDPAFFDCDVLWVCIPPKSRQGEAGHYPDKIDRVAKIAKQQQVKQIVFISSTGVYGDVCTKLTEQDIPVPDSESGRALLDAETNLQQHDGFTTTIIRFGGLIGPGREPARFFAGKNAIPNGLAPVNLIHLTDCISLSMAIIQQQAFGGLYNACTPHHPPRLLFYTKAAAKAGLELPEFINELKKWKIVTSQNSSKLLGYTYHITNWNEWLGSYN